MSEKVEWIRLPFSKEMLEDLDAYMVLESERSPTPITREAYLVSVYANFWFAKKSQELITIRQRETENEVRDKVVKYTNQSLEALKQK